MLLEELPYQQLDPSDIPSHLQDRIVLLGLFKVEFVSPTGSNVFLSNNSLKPNIIKCS